MMTEQPSEQTEKKIKILLDRSPEIESLKEDYEQQLAEKDEIIQKMLSENSKNYGDTAPLYEQPKRDGFQIEGSDIDPLWIKGSTVEKVINLVNKCAREANNKETFQRIQGRLLKKTITGSKPLSIEFQGSNKDFLRSPMPINEFDSKEIREQKEKRNERLRENRTNWREVD